MASTGYEARSAGQISLSVDCHNSCVYLGQPQRIGVLRRTRCYPNSIHWPDVLNDIQESGLVLNSVVSTPLHSVLPSNRLYTLYATVEHFMT